jgi:hypothetical protein
MKFSAYMLFLLTINLSISSNCSAGFFDDLKRKAAEIEKTVGTISEGIEQGVGAANEAKDPSPTAKVNSQPKAPDSQTNKSSGSEITGFVTGVSKGYVFSYSDNPSIASRGSVDFQLKDSVTKNVAFPCTRFTQDAHVRMDSPQHRQAVKTFEQARKSVKLTGIEKTKLEGVCTFKEIEDLNTPKTQTKPAKQVEVAANKPEHSLASGTGQSGVSTAKATVKQKKSKSGNRKYKPTKDLKSSVEGYMLIGTINPEISTIERKYEVSGDAGSKMVARFSLSNLAVPAKAYPRCTSYVADSVTTRNGDMSGELRQAVGARVFLSNVRPSEIAGLCVYRSLIVFDSELDKSAQLRQADLISTSKALKSERKKVFNRCQVSSKYRKYRCGCFADKYVNARKLFPDKDETYAAVLLTNECVNVSGFTQYEYNQCLNLSSTGMDRSTQDEYCNCYAIELENMLRETSLPDRHAKSRLLGQARSICRNRK